MNRLPSFSSVVARPYVQHSDTSSYCNEHAPPSLGSMAMTQLQLSGSFTNYHDNNEQATSLGSVAIAQLQNSDHLTSTSYRNEQAPSMSYGKGASQSASDGVSCNARPPSLSDVAGRNESYSGFVLDPEKCNQLSLEEKRKLDHRIAQWSEDAPKILSSLTRKELLEILCAKTGKERKYIGMRKLRMIEYILKLVSKNTKKPTTGSSPDFSPSKKQKHGDPLEQPSNNSTTFESTKTDHAESSLRVNELSSLRVNETRVCQNLACIESIWPTDAFCRRCSCCICHQFDDNKDPSLWLTCDWDSDSCNEGDEPCGMSCHLNCALNHQRAGISTNGHYPKLDGGFYCVSCGRLNQLMRTWRKQLVIANETRRVDALCLRVALSYKILEGTVKYQKLLKIVESAAKILESEVGPIGLASVEMDRRLVNRLACSTKVQKLCASAIEAFDSLCSNSSLNHFQPNRPPSAAIERSINEEHLSSCDTNT